MELTQETIIGLLTGSIATIILKGILDFFQKKADHKNELEKQIYGKKLIAAENAVKALYKSINSSFVIVNAIDSALNHDMDGELFEHIWKVYFKMIEDAESNLMDSTASLYFRFEDGEKWSSQDQQDLLNVYSKIKVVGEEIQYREEELQRTTDQSAFEAIENHIENKLRVEVKNEMRNLKNLLTKCLEYQKSLIDKIKADYR